MLIYILTRVEVKPGITPTVKTFAFPSHETAFRKMDMECNDLARILEVSPNALGDGRRVIEYGSGEGYRNISWKIEAHKVPEKQKFSVNTSIGKIIAFRNRDLGYDGISLSLEGADGRVYNLFTAYYCAEVDKNHLFARTYREKTGEAETHPIIFQVYSYHYTSKIETLKVPEKEELSVNTSIGKIIAFRNRDLGYDGISLNFVGTDGRIYNLFSADYSEDVTFGHLFARTYREEAEEEETHPIIYQVYS